MQKISSGIAGLVAVGLIIFSQAAIVVAGAFILVFADLLLSFAKNKSAKKTSYQMINQLHG